MRTITLQTGIQAPVERVFDLARSIDAHTESAGATGEKAVAGRMSGLIELHDRVTWEARHFGISQRLTVEVTRLERPTVFEDEMVQGAFATMHHRHFFESTRDGNTRMTDAFSFSAPYGWIGRLVEALFLEKYMRRFLIRRNRILKELAESERWREFLGEG